VDDLERARSTLRPAPPPPDVPSWDDVATRLEAVYRDVLA
jgi:hypothetical protein